MIATRAKQKRCGEEKTKADRDPSLHSSDVEGGPQPVRTLRTGATSCVPRQLQPDWRLSFQSQENGEVQLLRSPWKLQRTRSACSAFRWELGEPQLRMSHRSTSCITPPHSLLNCSRPRSLFLLICPRASRKSLRAREAAFSALTCKQSIFTGSFFVFKAHRTMHLPRLPGHGSHGHEEVVVLPDTSYTALCNKALEVVKKKLKVLQPMQRQIIIGAAAVVGVAVVCKTAAHLYTLEQRRHRWQLLRRCEQDGELHLFVLPRAPWSPSLSPACTRVEAYLRANNISYRATETVDPTGSPSGELPFLVYKHTRVDRLPRIFDFITRTFDVNMDGDLTREERALGAALRRTLEYSLEPFLYRTVFLDHPSLAIDQIARGLRVSTLRARMAVSRYAAELRKRLAVTSYGALVSEQYENEFLLDCEALELQIGEKRYLYSDSQLTTYDCAVYSLLVPFAYMGKYTALSKAYMAVSESAVLMAYIGRISRTLFADIGEPFNTSCDTPSSSSSLASSVHTENVHDDVAVSDWESSAQAARTSAVVDPPSTVGVGGGRSARNATAATTAA